MCLRACVRACVSLSLSFSALLSCFISQVFCLSLSFSLTHTHTRSHALSHSLTDTRAVAVANGVFLCNVGSRFRRLPDSKKKPLGFFLYQPTDRPAWSPGRAHVRSIFEQAIRFTRSPDSAQAGSVFVPANPQIQFTAEHCFFQHPTPPRFGAPNLYPHLSRTLTNISFSFSLSFSVSLSHTHTHIHTHIRTPTLSHFFTRPPPHSLLSRVSAALSSSNVRACFFPPFSLSYSFLLQFYVLASLSPLSLAFLPAVFPALVRFLSFSTPGSHDFNLKQS